MTACRSELLDRAVKERLEATLSLRDEPARRWGVKLLAQDDAGVWAQPLDEKRQGSSAIPAGAAAHVAFLHDHTRLVFHTTVIGRDASYWLNGQVMIEALLLAGTDDVRVEERRANRRHVIHGGCDVAARLFRHATETAADATELHASLWNLSLGGASFLHPFDRSLRAMLIGEPLTVLLRWGGREAELGARLLWTRTMSSGIIRLGVAFDQRSRDPAARAVLAAAVGELEHARPCGPTRTAR